MIPRGGRLARFLPVATAFVLGLLFAMLVFAFRWSEAVATPVLVALVIAMLALGFGLLGVVVAVVALEPSKPRPESEAGAEAARTCEPAYRTAPGDRHGPLPAASGASGPRETEARAVAAGCQLVDSNSGPSYREPGPLPKVGGDSAGAPVYTHGPWEGVNPADPSEQPAPGLRDADSETPAEARGGFPSLQALIEVWDDYRTRGDGFFKPSGLQRHLDSASVPARVVSTAELRAQFDLETGSDDSVIGVELRGEPEWVYLLPSFNHSPRAVAAYFADQGLGVRTARIQTLIQPARLSKRGTGRLQLAQGAVR